MESGGGCVSLLSRVDGVCARLLLHADRYLYTDTTITAIQHRPGHDANTTPLRQARYVPTHASTGTQDFVFRHSRPCVCCCCMPARHAVTKSFLHCLLLCSEWSIFFIPALLVPGFQDVTSQLVRLFYCELCSILRVVYTDRYECR